MVEAINLADKIHQQLPLELVNFMQAAGKAAASHRQNLYLVGGVVRDLLLGIPNFDLDLVVEGDAISLAHLLVPASHGKIITHPQFNTAKLLWDRWSVDLTTARSETYAEPGTLPKVTPGSLASDLLRRDFAINAMAVNLHPRYYGKLIDLYGGRDDLEHRFVRILHENSFIDDATRIWRGIRYEQRLNFRLERNTLRLLKRDIPMLETISGDRIRYELECIFQEECPEKALHRADELGVLQRLCPSLKGDSWLAGKFEQARQLASPSTPLPTLYLVLLAYRLNEEENEHLISYLRLSKSPARALRDSASLKAKLESLASPELAPSRIYHLLPGYCTPAVTANLIASYSPIARQHIRLFLSRLRYVKPSLTGDDLRKMGITPGPQMKEILERLLDARLDGKVKNKKDEEELVRGWLGRG